MMMIAAYKIWPIVSFLNFKFFSPDQQVIFIQAVAFFWSLHLSHLQSKSNDNSKKNQNSKTEPTQKLN